VSAAGHRAICSRPVNPVADDAVLQIQLVEIERLALTRLYTENGYTEAIVRRPGQVDALDRLAVVHDENVAARRPLEAGLHDVLEPPREQVALEVGQHVQLFSLPLPDTRRWRNTRRWCGASPSRPASRCGKRQGDARGCQHHQATEDDLQTQLSV